MIKSAKCKVQSANGFTLIELLVVISIIAVLTAIGMVAYADVQKRARDTQRRTDISNIAKALETHKTTTGYPVLSDSWFEKTIPTDPSNYQYCACTDTTAASDPAFGATGWSRPTAAANCPVATAGTCTSWTKVSNANPPAQASWRVCALMEATDEVFCKHSLQ